MMAVTQIWRVSRARAADGCASPAGDNRRRGHRAGTRLWVLLNAQALFDGTAVRPDGVAVFAEEDRRRMAARRPN
jgi:hypothetical protein